MTVAVRPYQQDLIDKARSLMAAGHKRVVLNAPTGAGKTRTSASIVASAVARNKRVLFVVSGRQLVTQALASYEALGVDAAPLMAGFTYRRDAPVQVASVHTLCSRMDTLEWLEPHLIVSDEAHEAASSETGMWARVRERWPHAFELGLSATPRPTRVYSALALGPSYETLIQDGHLVRPRFFSVPESDPALLKVSGGDYTEASQAAAFGKLTLVGGVVGHYRRFAAGRPTVLFGPDVATSRRNAEMFNEAGIAAFHLDADTPHDERQAAFSALADGSLKVLCNFAVLSRGFDAPVVSCVILERETKSLRSFIQMVGRGLRSYPGKTDCLVLDLGLNIHRHGDFVTDPPEWTLDGSRDPQKERSEQLDAKARKDVTCSACAYVYPAGPRCTNCGHKPEAKAHEAKDRDRLEAELAEVKPKARRNLYSFDDKRRWFGMLAFYAETKSKPPGWVLQTYLKKFSEVAPADVRTAPLQAPDKDVSGFIRSRNIAYAHRKPAPQYGAAHD